MTELICSLTLRSDMYMDSSKSYQADAKDTNEENAAYM